MMAVVLLTDNSQVSLLNQAFIIVLMLLVIASAYFLMLASHTISKTIGSGGAIIISKVMGLILASIAATQMLEGLKLYFQ